MSIVSRATGDQGRRPSRVLRMKRCAIRSVWSIFEAKRTLIKTEFNFKNELSITCKLRGPTATICLINLTFCFLPACQLLATNSSLSELGTGPKLYFASAPNAALDLTVSTCEGPLLLKPFRFPLHRFLRTAAAVPCERKETSRKQGERGKGKGREEG